MKREYRLTNYRGLSVEQVKLRIDLIYFVDKFIKQKISTLRFSKKSPESLTYNDIHAICLHDEGSAVLFEVILKVLSSGKDITQAEYPKIFEIFQGLSEVLKRRGYTDEAVQPVLLEQDDAAKTDSDGVSSAGSNDTVDTDDYVIVENDALYELCHSWVEKFDEITQELNAISGLSDSELQSYRQCIGSLEAVMRELKEIRLHPYLEKQDVDTLETIIVGGEIDLDSYRDIYSKKLKEAQPFVRGLGKSSLFSCKAFAKGAASPQASCNESDAASVPEFG